MKALFFTALAIHILSVLGILALLITQANKSPRKLNGGVLHAAWTALVAGIVMTSTYDNVHDASDALNHKKIGIKALVLLAIMFLGYRNVKKQTLSTLTWAAMLGLTIFNFVLVFAWK